MNVPWLKKKNLKKIHELKERIDKLEIRIKYLKEKIKELQGEK